MKKIASLILALGLSLAAMAQGEANGVMMYYALARLAKEQGLGEVAEKFIKKWRNTPCFSYGDISRQC